MKKLMMAAVALLMAVSVNAQTYLNESSTPFGQDKWYVGASTSSLGLSWHKASKWNFNLDAKGGYLFMDNWMITGKLGYTKQTDYPSYFNFGAGVRYYFDKCGVYLGASGNYRHMDSYSDFLPELNLGYAFFLTGKLTLEPELFYEISTKSSDYSGFGLRLGFGLYF